ncbi:MAG TPA: sulfatase-like hydrolase/transferase [Gemmatimonadales bacterium]|nr:sulfatase-like hydrolase/transferase [Gemmatimonadales bacterium]
MGPTNEAHPSHHLTVTLRLAALAWLAMAFQEVLLYTRPTPLGEPYVGRWIPYLLYALVYNLLGVMLVTTPVILLWLVWRNRSVRTGVATNIHWIHLGLLILVVVLDHLDNEIMRFMGIHLTYGLVRTYFNVSAWGEDILEIIRHDSGGPGLPFVILAVVPAALWWAGRRVIHSRPLPLTLPWPVALTISVVPLVIPLLIDRFRHPGDSRELRVRPEIITLYYDLGKGLARGVRPPRFDALARDYQSAWFQQSGDTTWHFPDPRRPLVRVPLAPSEPNVGALWNVIFIQLETFRGWNTGFLRPDVPRSATPHLDRLARDTASAFWRRHLSFGPPTISGFIAALCSIKPHSREDIMVSYTYTALDCLPTVLRRRGYVAELFTGTDPDWDNQTVWLQQWYDDFHYYGDLKGADRPVFRRAAERIRQLGRGRQPFMATVISISNHVPFRSRHIEMQFVQDANSPPAVAIRNSMRYTDDVLREFIEVLRREPWFARTLVVITGDHGYDLGEHGTPGQDSGWRESVWVPLVIHGAHARLPRGGHDEPASLLDIAPTVADLLGIREPTHWMGSSLARAGRRGWPFAASRRTSTFGEHGRFSMVVHPRTGKAGLYDAIQDPLQQKDISAAHPEVVAALRSQAENERLLVDYLLEANLVWSGPRSSVRMNSANLR